MKKLIVLVLILGLATSIPAMNYGVKAGVSMGFIKFRESGNDYEFKEEIGGLAGLFVEVPLTRNLSLQPEALFHFYHGGTKEGGNSMALREIMAEIPVMLKYTTTLSGKKISLMAGGSFAFGFNPQVNEGSGWDDLADADWVKLNISAVVGVSLDIGKLIIDLRVNLGLNNRLSDSSDILRYNSLVLSGGYRL